MIEDIHIMILHDMVLSLRHEQVTKCTRKYGVWWLVYAINSLASYGLGEPAIMHVFY